MSFNFSIEDLISSLVMPFKSYDPNRGLASARSSDTPDDEQASPIAMGNYMMPRIGPASAFQPGGSDSASAQDPQQNAGLSLPDLSLDGLRRNVGVGLQNAVEMPGGPIAKAAGFGLGAMTGMRTDPASLLQYGGELVNSAAGSLQDLTNKLTGGMTEVAKGAGDFGTSTQEFLSKVFGGPKGGLTGQSDDTQAADPQVAGPPLNLLPPGIAPTAANIDGMSPVDASNNALGGAGDAGHSAVPDQNPDATESSTQNDPQAPDNIRRVSSRYDTRAKTGNTQTPQAEPPSTATAPNPKAERMTPSESPTNRKQPETIRDTRGPGGNGSLSQQYLDAIKRSEGYTEKAKWDYKQHSSGYGTKAEPGDDKIPPDQRKAVYEKRFQNKIGEAAAMVDSFSSNLPPGIRAALTSLTYNSGPGWQKSGLGKAIKSGDYDRAREIFLQYHNVTIYEKAKDGSTVSHLESDPGLVKRRQREAAWFDER